MVTKTFLRERNAMLLAADVEGAKTFHRKYNPDVPLPSDEAMEIGLHKARTAVPSLPKEARELSRRWLAERGYSSWE